MAVLVTGGAGYIGSHICVELLNRGYELVILDNLSNSSSKSIDRISRITGKQPHFVIGDIADTTLVSKLLKQYPIHSVIHMAGLKAVGDSVKQPLDYYTNNVVGTVAFLKVLNQHAVKKIIFSSSATVYGVPQFLPYTEEHPLSAINPYGRTKLFVEDILRDLSQSDQQWSIGILRYFNPIGAHASGLIGEDPNGVPNNLMPYITQVAIGKLPYLNVWGNDYPTIDGTGVRDYIHVVDLADAHIKALENLESGSVLTLNIGTGIGYSVLEVVEAFEKASGIKIPIKFQPRRAGDLAAYYASPKLAEQEVGWSASKNILEMCRDTWNWQKNNQNGYAEN